MTRVTTPRCLRSTSVCRHKTTRPLTFLPLSAPATMSRCASAFRTGHPHTCFHCPNFSLPQLFTGPLQVLGDGYTIRDDGLIYRDFVVGSGDAPSEGQEVTFDYTAYNESGGGGL